MEARTRAAVADVKRIVEDATEAKASKMQNECLVLSLGTGPSRCELGMIWC